MDAVTRVSFYFPAQSLSSFWLLSNLIMSNAACTNATQGLMVAMLVVFCIFVIVCSFTDTYTASNNIKYLVLLMPFYGPVCFSLPTDFDKDRVYDNYYLKVRDYIRAGLAMICFLLIVLFITPISVCLFPESDNPNISTIDPAVVRTVPVVVAILCALIFMCLGTPRQCIGYQNVDETCPPLEQKMGDNPIFSQGRGTGGSQNYSQFPGPPPSIPEGGEDDDYNGPGPYSSQPNPSNSYQSGSMLHKQSSQGYRGGERPDGYREERYDSRGGRTGQDPRQSARHSRSPEPGVRNSRRDMGPPDDRSPVGPEDRV